MEPDAPIPEIDNLLANAPQSVEWLQTLELGYDEPEARPTVCFGCGSSTAEKLSKCGKCQVATYCSRDCQVNDWKEGGHKMACQAYNRLTTFQEAETKAQIRKEVFGRIRFYACPYAVHKTAALGSGFLFIQSDTALQDLSIPIPKDTSGRVMPTRSILMHYLTLGEYDAEVCRDDFEMTVVRSKLQEAVEKYDPEKQVVLLWRLRCGHVALGTAILVPDVGICKKLGEDYFANNPAGAIQLNLDDL